MGGDHRCPVCQATFTRPQHVARHMRSHTGDRPYKCLYCGDQFARSDLLSRHCNKCHANEKPLANAGARRRGSASASRATTSKQACDQCVQSSLPCDGANPCTKCVQRKSRCTYVKFHRQTAPVGPGHNTRPATMGPAGANPPIAPHMDSQMSMYAQADDHLLLGPQPTVGPPMADNIYSQPFNFPPIYEHSADPSLSLAGNPDLGVGAKYRTQPDPYRRSSAPGAGLIPGLYTDPRQQHPSNWMAWGQENDPSFTSTTTNEGIHVDKNLHPYLGTQGVSAYPHPNAYIDQRDRRGSSSDYASEGSSATSQSMSSSAASSSVHLPGAGMGLHFPSDQHPFGAPPADRIYANRGQEGGFSSAFGLMSLDDPNALAGISNDGAPFFSSEALSALGSDDPNQTPVPAQTESKRRRGSTAQTPSKEAEIRELREFWKQYIRTPLSGSSLMCSGNDGSSPQTQRQAAPSPFSYRRPRVSSMPSTKSPLSVDRERPPQNCDDGNVMSSIRTTLTAQDDLKSYEAAVLARKAPTTLRIGPKARRKTGGPSPNDSPQIPNIHEEQKVINLNYSPTLSRPPSAKGVPALPSLNFNGKMHLPYTQDQVSTSSPPSRESSISVDDSTGSGSSDREGLRPSFKRLPSQALGPPNSKRAQLSPEDAGLGTDSASSSGIPVPVYANRASDCGVGVDFDGGNVHSRPSSSVPDRPTITVPGNMFVEHGRPLTGIPHHTFQHTDRNIVNISERHRRMSAPTMTAPSLPSFTFVAPPGPGPGAIP